MPASTPPAASTDRHGWSESQIVCTVSVRGLGHAYAAEGMLASHPAGQELTAHRLCTPTCHYIKPLYIYAAAAETLPRIHA